MADFSLSLTREPRALDPAASVLWGGWPAHRYRGRLGGASNGAQIQPKHWHMSALDQRDARILVLLNPGQMSRHWLLGMAAGAERLGVLAGTLELGPVWSAIESATPANIDDVRNQLAGQIVRFCQQRRVTHVLSYLHNGAFEPGLFPDERNIPVTLFTRAGIRHIMIWSDHPNWALDGAALNPTVAEILGHPSHTHVLKSAPAAAEASAILKWPNVHAMHMGEDFTALQPARNIDVIHDAVIIMADAMPVPGPLVPFLDEDNPRPEVLASTMRSTAVHAAYFAIDRYVHGDVDRAMCRSLVEEWVEARIKSPHVPFWSLIPRLDDAHADAVTVLRRDPRLYYETVHAMQHVTAWRRFFWPSWLARRISLGIYGSPATRMNIPTPPGGDVWIPNANQPEIYARGKVAININAGHDEAGLTHKPFQIAASGVPCLHFTSQHLDECFSEGSEIVSFDNGPALLDAIHGLAASAKRRADIAEAARARGVREHDWEKRVLQMLAFAEQDRARAEGRPRMAA